MPMKRANPKGIPKSMIISIVESYKIFEFIQKRGIIKKILKETKKVITHLLKVENLSPNKSNIMPKIR